MIVGMLSTLIGALFSFFIGYIVEFEVFKNRVYTISWITMLISTILCLGFYLLFYFEKLNVHIFSIMFIVLGIISTPYLGLGFEKISDSDRTIPKNIPITFTLIIATIMDLAFVKSVDTISKDKGKWFMFISFVIYLLNTILTIILDWKCRV